MKRTVVILPQLHCSGCGFALRDEDGYRHGDTEYVVECYTESCPQFGERLAFPLQFVECEVKQQTGGGC